MLLFRSNGFVISDEGRQALQENWQVPSACVCVFINAGCMKLLVNALYLKCTVSLRICPSIMPAFSVIVELRILNDKCLRLTQDC